MTIAIQLLSIALSCGLVAAGPLSTSPATVSPSSALTLAPVLQPGAAHADKVIKDSYIVVLKPGVSPSLLSAHTNMVKNVHAASGMSDITAGLRHIYDNKLKGYAGTFNEATLNHIRTMPEVDYVEQDQLVQAYNLTRQLGAPWGLARISHRNKISFSTFGRYEYDGEGGEGVDVYVIDTGINIKHVEFQGRAFWGKTIPVDASDTDGNGHGTHCAGTIASRKYGVAKKANVYAVKVLGDNGSGSMSDVVGGVAWASDAASLKLQASRQEFAKTGKTAHKGSVANMSLGGGKSRALDQAVNDAVEAGMHFAVAAGNDNRDACDYPPAAAELAVTVGASTLEDERAYFSNHGPCVDVFAPGMKIGSTWTGSPNAENTISGTSMASPHTAGLLAYFLSLYGSGKFMPEPEDSTTLAQNFATIQGVLSGAQSNLPSWVGSWLPRWLSRAVEPQPATAPIPPTISPAQLKKALLLLSTPDKLKELPAKTVNLLIFNNATRY